ncbi:MAG TPA: tetratricopeptide repeat protein [Candidatus Acidoferrales bacterium]|nr:tetratricopeptide repeat protein [Candidatus Acidoferrales bacterium]
MVPLTRRIAILSAIASCCAPGAGQDPWLKLTSANFELYTTAGEHSGRDLIRHFEQVRCLFVQAFGANLPSAKPVRIVVFRAESVDTPEISHAAGMPARLALAELLTNYRGRYEQARSAYETLARDYPDRWEVEAEWGQWCRRLRKLDDAARHYARAVESGARDPGLYLAYARVLGYTNRAGEAIEVLDRAANLDLGSDEIHLELGALYVRQGNYGAALAQLGAVKKMESPQGYRYYYSLALSEHRLGRDADARAHAAKARGYTRNPEEVASLDRLERAMAHPEPPEFK